MGINANEIKIGAHLIEEAVDATKTAIHESPTATRLLEASGLHMPHIAMPAILGDRIGSLLTPDKIRTFAEDLFGRLADRPLPDFDLEDNLNSTGWNQHRKMAAAERAISRAGLKIDGLTGVRDTQALYDELKGSPSARGALTIFNNARREYLDATSAYNKAVVGPKFADTYNATSTLVKQTGLIKPQLKISSQLTGADASYSDFKVEYAPNTFDDSSVALVRASAHELTHLEQNQLQLFFKADQMGIGQQASPEQIQTINQWFKAMGSETSVESIKRGLEVRAGKHLTDEAAERARGTISSRNEIRQMAAANWPHRQRFEILKQLEGRASVGSDAQGVILELAHQQNGLELNNRLFGSERGAQFFAKYSQNAGAAENFASLSKSQRNQLSMGLIEDLNVALEDTQLKLTPYFKAYRTSQHEVEAFNNGDFAASFHPRNFILKRSLNLDDL